MHPIIRKIIIFKLQLLARLILKKYKPKIVAVTGSVGKTSTKDAVAAMLEAHATVWKSKKSQNSEIGLAITVLGCENAWGSISGWMANIWHGISMLIFRYDYPEWLVLEVGIGKPGDMQKTAGWLQTDVVVTSLFGETPVHVEFFADKDAVSIEEFSLVKTLKNSGVLVVNQDDEKIPMLLAQLPAPGRIVTYGFSESAQVRGSHVQVLYEKKDHAWEVPTGMVMRVGIEGNSLPITLRGGVGVGHVTAPLAACAVLHALDMNVVQALSVFDDVSTMFQPGRMRLIDGREGSTIVDDSYNAAPVAVQSGLHVLSNLETKGRRIAVLGDMLELGKHTQEEHAKIGMLVAELKNIALLFVVGPRAEDIAKSAIEHGYPEDRVLKFRDSRLAIAPLVDILADRDIVFVKGSQGVRMERIVEAVMARPEEAIDLLPRQDAEWKKRNK
jgi:UDP-N-acetylmuramoyl-tripeptide--D-alanyl-D-alanine ligase